MKEEYEAVNELGFLGRKRGFEVAKGFEDKNINLPKRATKHAAGYDFEASEDVVIPTIWDTIQSKFQNRALWKSGIFAKPTLVPTGVKSFMGQDEYLQLTNRSSNPLKNLLLLSNGVGVIDSDYYENPDNDGHIMFQFINFGITDKVIRKGERIGQGIFLPFLKADNDLSDGEERVGGHGSTK